MFFFFFNLSYIFHFFIYIFYFFDYFKVLTSLNATDARPSDYPANSLLIVDAPGQASWPFAHFNMLTTRTKSFEDCLKAKSKPPSSSLPSPLPSPPPSLSHLQHVDHSYENFRPLKANSFPSSVPFIPLLSILHHLVEQFLLSTPPFFIAFIIV